MRKFIITTLLAVIIVTASGCDILESMFSNVNGLDLSACVDGWTVCLELFWDNIDKVQCGVNVQCP